MVAAAYAQPKKVVVDKILAVVGDKIILQSEIKNTISDAKRRGGEVPPDAECYLLEQNLVSKILMMQSEKDSIPVSDDDVEAALDNKVREWVKQFGTIENLEEVAGKTVYQLKAESKDAVREQLMAEGMQHAVVKSVRITPSEVKTFYDKIPFDSLPVFESELEIGQIIIFPKPAREIELYIISELQKYKKQIESGTVTFEMAEKNYSEDEGTKQMGGKLQLNRNEKTWDPTFLSTAFRLKDGQISEPFKSKFGYHIIKMISRNGDDAVVSHILRIPPITDAEIAIASKKLDSVRSEIIAGKFTFNDAAQRYSDPDHFKFNGAYMLNAEGAPSIKIDQLGKDMIPVLDKLKVGDISQPTSFVGDRGQKGVRLIYLKSRTEPHRLNMKDDFSRLSNWALEEKKNKILNDWIKSKIGNYYIMLDDSIKGGCPRLVELTTTTTTGTASVN